MSAVEAPRTAAIRRRTSPPAPSIPTRLSCPVISLTAEATVGGKPGWRGSSPGIFPHRCKLGGLVIGYQGIDQLIQGDTLENIIELVQRQADTMVGDPPLREIVGADALRPVTGANLVAALRGAHVGRPVALHFEQARAEHLHRKPAILVLGLLG